MTALAAVVALAVGIAFGIIMLTVAEDPVGFACSVLESTKRLLPHPKLILTTKEDCPMCKCRGR